MSATYAKQLNSRDSQSRRAAIHAAARAKDRSMLQRLAVMCTDDPDPEIRDLARRAGIYIRQQLGELTAETGQAETGKPSKPPKIPVSEADIVRAQKVMDGAVTQQIAGEKAKAIKYMRQAVALNPNLRHDPFFINLANTITGLDGAAAVEQVLAKETQGRLADEEARQRRDYALNDHLAEIAKGDPRGVMLDAALFFLAVAVGTLIFGFWRVQVGQGYLQAIADNYRAVDEARARGDQRVDEATGEIIYLSTELDATGKPRRFTEMSPDAGLVTQAEAFSRIDTGSVVLAGLGMGVAAVILAMLATGVMHTLGSALGGKGRWAYLAHHVLGLLTLRAIILLVISSIGLKVIFDSNGGVIITLVYAAIGAVALFTFIRLLGMARKAYHFGAGQGLAAALAGTAIFLLGTGMVGVVLL